jgi:hypothetical protein
MKQQLSSLESLAATLTQQAKGKEDFVAPTRALSMTAEARLEGFSAGAADITDLGHQQLSEHTGIPRAYYDRLKGKDGGVLAANVNLWLGARPAGERRMVRTLDGNVRALLSDRYQRIDNYEVAETSLGLLTKIPQLRIVSSAVTDSRLYIKAVSSALQLPVPGSRRVGDLVETGVVISNSEVGLGSVSIQPFAHFLVCTNGMVRNKEGLRKTHVGRAIDADLQGLLSDQTKRLQDAAVLSQVKDVIAACFERANFESFLERLGVSTQQRIEGDVVKAVEALQPTFGLSKAEGAGVLRHLIEGGDLSRYGLINAVTRTGEDVEDYDRATELEAMGFRLLTAPDATWKVISEA